MRERLVAISHRLTLMGLVLLIAGVGFALTLLLDVIGLTGGGYIVAATLASFLLIWFGLPMWYRLRHRAQLEPGDEPVREVADDLAPNRRVEPHQVRLFYTVSQ